MGRKVSWKLYAAAFVVTALIFALGFFLGWLFNQQAFAQVNEELERVNLDASVLQTLLLMQPANLSCDFYEKQLAKFDEEASALGKRLDAMEAQGKLNPRLKSAYFLMEIRNMLIVTEVGEKCSRNYVVLLFFYSNQRALEPSLAQGKIITAVKKKKPNLMVYSFDVDIENSAVEFLEARYNIASVPSIVVDGFTYAGIVGQTRLEQIVG
jgi:hypothetical protein